MNAMSHGEVRSNCFSALEHCCGFRFPTTVQHSWYERRAVNEGLLTLSVLREDVRLRLLAAWMKTGEGLLEFISGHLPEASAELAVCRFERLYQEAFSRAKDFAAPDPERFRLREVVQRAAHAGVICLREEPSVLVAPGLRALCRIASPAELRIWDRVIGPTRIGDLMKEGCEGESVALLLQIGALEYAC
jgi:hypothetical protein